MSNKPPTAVLKGIATARGFAAGPVFFFSGSGEHNIPEYRIAPSQVETELLRLKKASLEVRRDIEGLLATLRERRRNEEAEIFEGHLMILEDPLLHESTVKNVREGGFNVEAALRKTIVAFRERFAQMNDQYFRERVQDLNDVERRLQEALAGFGGFEYALPQTPSVIVANELLTSEVVRLPRELVLALVTSGGSATSHLALLARSMGIPAVSGVENLNLIEAGETLLVDGTHGTVTRNPDPETLRDFEALKTEAQQLSAAAIAPGEVGKLKDGSEVRLFANVHEGMDFSALGSNGAQGIGLYRSEYLWMKLGREPTEAEQFAAYGEVARAVAKLGERTSVAIRVLDIGGDKLVKGLTSAEDNPFLGNRSIRYLLSHCNTFRTQLKAILRASALGPVKLLYPMIAGVEELSAANQLLVAVKSELDAEGIAYDRRLQVGIMIEVPAAALNADALAKQVDFFSIGTNDLVQYTLAADRGNEAVANLYQPLHPAIVKLMKLTMTAAETAAIPVSVCGASAGDPVTGVLWAAMGAKVLSMSAAYIPVMAKLFSQLTRADLDEFAEYVLALPGTLPGRDAYESARQWLGKRLPSLANVVL